MEVATRDGADLGDLPHRRQPIKPRHQRRVQCRRDPKRWQRTLEHIIPVPLLHHLTFQHRLGQLLDEQRHAIGARKNLVRHLLRQALAARHLFDQCRAVTSAHACERDRRHVRVTGPGRREFWPGGHEQQRPKSRHLLHRSGEQLQRGWVDPVDILESNENGLLGRHGVELGQQRGQRLLLALLRTQLL